MRATKWMPPSSRAPYPAFQPSDSCAVSFFTRMDSTAPTPSQVTISRIRIWEGL